MGDEFNFGTALAFFEPLSGSEEALELFPEELVGLGGGALELDGVELAVSPAPPLPPAVRGISVG
jgi:hypothetical protein